MQVVTIKYVNDHFHHNNLVYILHEKRYFSLIELANALGGEYSDLEDGEMWTSICFVLDKGEQKVRGQLHNITLPIGFGLQSLFNYLDEED